MTLIYPDSELRIKYASQAALASLLNLTILPLVGFIALLFILKKTNVGEIDRYHVVLGLKLNIVAAVVLFFVSGAMILVGGFDSPWTWVYVISYFTLVHTVFIIISVWALVRSWSGQRLRT